MKTNILANIRVLAILIAGLTIGVGNVWAVDPPTLSGLSFPSPSIDENFNDVSTISTTARFNPITTEQSDYGAINHLFNNNSQNQNTIAISASGNNMTSNYFSLSQGSTQPVIAQISGGDDFAQSGAWRITIEKSSTYYFGLHKNATSNSPFSYGDVSVFLRNVDGAISIQDGSGSSHWTPVGSSTNNTIDICVVYNLTNTSVTYGGSISLASMKAHVYIDGTCVNSAGTPTAFTLRNNATVTAFRIATNGNSTHAYVDDIKVYKSLPTAASCDATPSVGAASLNGSFTLSSVGVQCASASAGTGCSLSEYGFVWGTSNTGTHPDATDNVVTNAGAYTANYTNNLTGTFVAGNTYYYRGYAKNNGDNYGYSSEVKSFTPYTVDYVKNEGSAGGSTPSQQVVNTGGTVTLAPASGNFTWTGHHITKWAVGSAGGTQYTPNTTSPAISDNTTFYAIWATNTYTVTFDKNGGGTGTGTADQNFTYGTAQNLNTCGFTAPTDKYFYGWNTDQSAATAGTRQYEPGESVNNLSPNHGATVTLYAVWKDHSYTNYRTVCCTPLGTIGGTVTLTQDGNSVTVKSWTYTQGEAAAESNISTYDVYLYSDADSYADPISTQTCAYNAKVTGVSFTGLSYARTYKIKIGATGNTNYCEITPIQVTTINSESTQTFQLACEDAALAYGTGSVTKTFGASDFTNELTNDHGVTVTYSVTSASPAGCVTVNSSGQVHIVSAGTATINATSEIETVSNVKYCADNASYSLTVNKANISPTLSYTSTNLYTGDNSSNPTISGNTGSGSVSYAVTSATPAGCVTVDPSTGVVSAVEAGSATITATIGATTNYNGNTATATFTITAASYFINGATVFIQAESSSAWDASACVKAWFNASGAGGAAQTTYWLFDATGNKKIYAAVVPASGDLNQVTLQRFQSDCLAEHWYNNNGTLTKASDGGSNIFCSNGSGNNNVAWNGTALTMSLMSSVEWNTPVATLTDQGAGVWSGTYEYTPSGISTDYIVKTNYNGNIGNTNSNNNATLSGMTVGSTYNVTATLNVTTHSFEVGKTFVKGEVHFNLQGHGDAIADLTNVTAGSKISAPSEPSETHYTFGGWFTNQGCTAGNEWDFENDVVNETMTLFAKWTPDTYTITKTFSNIANAGLPASFTYTGGGTDALNSTFTVDGDNYLLPSSITVTMGGTPLTLGSDYTYNSTSGAFTFLPAITGDIVITATATAKLKSIAITTQPDTRKYLAGETFSSAGAVVTATMGDGSTKDVMASVTWTPAGALSAGTGQTVTASYTENNVTETATTTIDVYGVTVNKVAASDGSAIDTAVITATCTARALEADVTTSNFKFKNWEFDGSNNGLTITSPTSASTTLTGTPTGNVTIKAVFYKPITVTWKVGNGAASGSPTTEVKYDTKVTELPSTPDVAAVASCGDANTFMGWTALGKLEGTGNAAPADLFNSTSDAGCAALTENTIYRAVFATRSGSGSAGYNKVTDSENITNDGRYLIVYEASSTSAIIFDGSLETLDGSADTIMAQISSSFIAASSKLASSEFTIDMTNLYIKSASNKYINYSSNSYENGLSSLATTGSAALHSISIDGSGNFVVFGTCHDSSNPINYVQLKYNTLAAGSPNYGSRFRFYKHTTGDTEQIQLYKYDSGVSYSDYITGCCTPLGAIGGAVEYTNPTTVVLTWNKMSNVDAETPYTITYRTGEAAYGSSNVGAVDLSGAKATCTITNLACNTPYDFKIAVTAAEDYCDKEEVVTETSPKYSITKGSITGGSFTTKISTDAVTEACNGATIAIEATPSAGYTFSSWTITNDDNSGADVTSTLLGGSSTTASTSFTMPSYSVTVTPTFSCITPNHIDITGNWDRFGGETISLTATAYATNDDSSPIAAADITGYQWQKWYNGQWNNMSDAGNISGTNTNNLVITNCTGNNSGSYQCAITTGAGCSPATQDIEVKVFTLECYTGGETTYNFTRDGENQRGSVEITLTANTAYAFKIHADNVYYGNNGTVNEDVTDWECSTSEGNLTVNSGLGGTFTFTMDYSSGGSSSTVGIPELSITYPRKTIYLTPGVWNTGDAKFAIYYFRKEGGTIYGEGFTDFITAGDCGSITEIPQWNGVQINAVRLNSNTTTEELTNPASHYAAAWAKRWNQTSNITVTSYNNVSITGWGPENGDSPYTYGTYSVPTYTISYATGTTAHTGGNAISGEKASETKTCGMDFTLPGSAVFTTTGYTQTGWATEDGGSQAYALGGSYTTNAAQAFYPAWTANTHSLTWSANGGDALAGDYTQGTVAYGTTIVAPNTPTWTGHRFDGWGADVAATMPDNDLSYTAQWSLASYSVTLTTNGGTINAGNVTSYTYGTGATLPTNITRDGYRFDGWFDNEGLTGSAVTNISSSATGDKQYWAKWTAIYTVTWHVGNGTWSVGEHNVNAGNTQVLSGEKIAAMPDEPANNTLNACANKFMGWSTHSWGSTPKGTGTGEYDDLFFDVAHSPYINGTTHFYAVFAEEVNSGTYSDGTTHQWLGSSGYEDWGGSATYSWLRNNNAPLPTFEYTPAYGVKKIVLNVKQTQTAGSNTVAVSVGGTAVGSTATVGSESGTKDFDLTFDHGTGTPLSGKVSIVLTNTSGSGTGKGTFYLNSITLYEGDPDKELINYVTLCADDQVRVTYDFNGGYGSACTEGVTTKTASYTVCTTEPTKSYYDFDGWSDGTNTYAAGATGYNLQANTTFTAQWTPTTYNITYENMEGATNAVENVATYTIATSTITLGAPTRGHDRFEGWFTDDGVWADEVTSIASGSHGNITLYAKWTTRHEIIFDYTESASSGKTTIYRADDENMEDAVAGQGSVPSDPSAPTNCSSKVFVGWSKDLIADETDTRPSDLMKPAAGTVDADKHYYAVWASSTSGSKTLVLEITRADFDASYHDGDTQDHSSIAVANDGSGATMNVDWQSANVGDFSSKIQIKNASGAGFWNTTDLGSISNVSITSGTDVTHYENTSAHPTSTSGTTKGYFTVTKDGNNTGKATKVTVTFTKTISYNNSYSTSCCATKVTLSQNSPENGTIVFGKASVGTCGGDKEVSLTITPAAGYQLHSYEVATGSGKVAATTDPSISLDNNSSAAQDITLTFASGANGAYDVTANFTEMVVTNWTWTNHDGGAALTTDPIEIYVDQQARVDVTYTPAKAELVSTHTAATYYNHDATGSAYVRNPQKASEYFTFYGKASTGDETTVITLTHNDDASNPKTFPQLIYVKVLPLPKVHFVDNVHNESFSDVVATIVENALSATKQTPTSNDYTGSTLNTCEEQHLHLVGWIDGDWDPYKAYMNGTGAKPDEATITGATGYFYAPGADIDVSAKDGKTYYAVWAKVE